MSGSVFSYRVKTGGEVIACFKYDWSALAYAKTLGAMSFVERHDGKTWRQTHYLYAGEVMEETP